MDKSCILNYEKLYNCFIRYVCSSLETENTPNHDCGCSRTISLYSMNSTESYYFLQIGAIRINDADRREATEEFSAAENAHAGELCV
jgi:hypothetical protein